MDPLRQRRMAADGRWTESDRRTRGHTRSGCLSWALERLIARLTRTAKRSHDDLVSLEVSRHSVGGFIGRTVAESDVWQLDVVAGAALVSFRRQASPRNPRFSPSPTADRTSFATSLEVRALWAPTPTFPVQLGVTLGADALASPPSFSYATANGVVEQPSWFVEPRAAFFALLRPR